MFPFLVLPFTQLGAAKEISGKMELFQEFRCYDSHADGKEMRGLGFDKIDLELSAPVTIAKWKQVFHRVESGEMPPEKVETRPPEEERPQQLIRGEKIGGTQREYNDTQLALTKPFEMMRRSPS